MKRSMRRRLTSGRLSPWRPGRGALLDDQSARYVATNLAGHVNILELARDRRVDHLVYASFSSVYGASPDLPFRIEQRVNFPISLYAANKKLDELMSETYAHLYRIPQTGLRFFTVYGPWGRPTWLSGASPTKSVGLADRGVQRRQYAARFRLHRGYRDRHYCRA